MGDYLHQQVGNTDLYFLRNGSDHISRHDIAFRVTGKTPELWDAVTGEMLAPLSPHLLEDGRPLLSVELPPFGSIIVAFANDKAQSTPPVIRERETRSVKILRPWEITFQQGRGGPQKPIYMQELKDWTTSTDPAVRFFSGAATYRTSMLTPEVSSGKHIWLRFDDIREIARVKVNGMDAGTVWAKPLLLRVDPFLKPGENQIEIEVTNLWPNRIIGDLQPGNTHGITHTNITKFKLNSPLLPSGLLGTLHWFVEP